MSRASSNLPAAGSEAEASAQAAPTGAPSSAEQPIAFAPAKSRRPAHGVWHRAVYRWTAIAAVMGAFLVLYTQHPYYARGGQFAPFRPLYIVAFSLWIALGAFYCRATLVRFSERRYVMRDGALHLILLAKAFTERRFWRVAKNPRIRTTLLGILVKGFFTPLMTGFLAGHLNSIAKSWLVRRHLPPLDFKLPPTRNPIAVAHAWWEAVGSRLPELVPNAQDLVSLVTPWTWSRAELSWGLGLVYDLIFMVDCGWALVGYATESRWLGNKTRSVEPTAFGWAVCLACYPPFNSILGTYLPLDNGKAVVTDDVWLLVLRGATVCLFAIYASATVSFGFRFSNLTNRGIVTRGPYRFVRHPAYLTKCAAWWLEHIPTMTPAKALFLCGLCGVYALRAWTEERHLGRDPDYRAYKEKVRSVLIPGVV